MKSWTTTAPTYGAEIEAAEGDNLPRLEAW